MQSFQIFSERLRKCFKAIPPRTIKVVACPFTDAYCRWRWTEDGQIQNIATGLCIDVDRLNQGEDLRLSVCNFRKSFQKWRCQVESSHKLYYVNTAHTGKFFRWRVLDKGEARLTIFSKFASWSRFDFDRLNICDFNHRGKLLVVKVPSNNRSLPSSFPMPIRRSGPR